LLAASASDGTHFSGEIYGSNKYENLWVNQTCSSSALVNDAIFLIENHS